VDSDHDIWEHFAVRAWPTLVLVDAGGYVRETLSETEAPLAARVGRCSTRDARGARWRRDPSTSPTGQRPDVPALPGQGHLAERRHFVADRA
jgi:hypothetical protein